MHCTIKININLTDLQSVTVTNHKNIYIFFSFFFYLGLGDTLYLNMDPNVFNVLLSIRRIILTVRVRLWEKCRDGDEGLSVH